MYGPGYAFPQVYNVSSYLRFHPGGEKILLSVAGKDATSAFDRYHRWVNIPALIGRLVVGKLVDGATNKATAEEGDGAGSEAQEEGAGAVPVPVPVPVSGVAKPSRLSQSSGAVAEPANG